MQARNVIVITLVAGALLFSGAFLYTMEANNNYSSDLSTEITGVTVDKELIFTETQECKETSNAIGTIEGVTEADIVGTMEYIYADEISEGVNGNYFLSNNAHVAAPELEIVELE